MFTCVCVCAAEGSDWGPVLCSPLSVCFVEGSGWRPVLCSPVSMSVLQKGEAGDLYCVHLCLCCRRERPETCTVFTCVCVAEGSGWRPVLCSRVSVSVLQKGAAGDLYFPPANPDNDLLGRFYEAPTVHGLMPSPESLINQSSRKPVSVLLAYCKRRGW